ncbi:penicillin-binding protein 1A [Rickettsiales endosymbiont of Stachyamoeba lipophora]|uniref:penicillin-binding protein 1A n=1 Tax=Rickettsiales endosymbiont of Stachyamoeba lipophora TaxID=2486578 RepID=UPI000F6558E4|nr:PBP1A family penicillin-binding protein [Rickettsiales endosymbiont of Stachyamoeba lipophora]AZL15855.1 PBP1A family penicillin-binding protein [Rickettsiales endosymbiont of Stachyamoeba lipophora]
MSKKRITKKNNKRIYKKFLYFISFSVFSLSLLGAASLLYLVRFYHDGLPDYKQLANYNPPLTTRIYDKDANLVAEYFVENRIYIPFNKIPHNMVNAFIAAEDQNYYSHPGVDYTSLLRAIFQNLLNLGSNKSLVGGSTITQQVVKNFLLSNERTITRKIKEAILSFRITQVYSKNKILELYLNQIYLGRGAYGVAAAALAYFDKPIDQLTLGEVAYIAGLPKAPSNYNPNNNYYRAKARRDYVINRMYEEGMINEEQAKPAMMSKLDTVDPADHIKNNYQDYFNEHVRRTINDKFGYKELYEGGLSIITTLNSDFQKKIQTALSNTLVNYDQAFSLFRKPLANINIHNNIPTQLKQLKISPPLNWQIAAITNVNHQQLKARTLLNNEIKIELPDNKWIKTNINNFAEIFKPGDVIYVEANQGKYFIRQVPEVNGGMIAIEPNSGRILALSGGFDFKVSEFNRATQAIRQPGSTIKPFVYLAALELGVSPTTIYPDAPVEIYLGPGLPLWRPKNYKGDFLGDITFRTALEKSRNTVTARIAEQIGMNKIAEAIKRFGINDNPDKNFAVVLGSSETTLIKMVTAYSMIANGGKYIKPYAIEQVYDHQGISVQRSSAKYCSDCNNISSTPMIQDSNKTVTDERTAFQMLSILEGAVSRGTSQKALKLKMHLFGKTGTSNDSKDIWYIGGNNQLVVGIYLGYDQPKSLGQRVSGATHALPGFIEFMESIKSNLDNYPFTPPNGIKLINIFSRTGQPADSNADGKEVIQEAFKIGAEPTINQQFNENQESDEVPERINDGIY